jgi:hypothetical protein
VLVKGRFKLNFATYVKQLINKLSVVFSLIALFVFFQNCGQMRTPQAMDNLASLGFNHLVLKDGQSCSICHEADRAMSDHFAGEDCKGCHNTYTWKDAVGGASHSPVPDSCNNCHGVDANYDHVSAVNHLDYGTNDCVQCHQSAINNGFQSWANGIFPHNQINPTSCNSCHDTGKTYDRITGEPKHTNIDTTGKDCIECHQNTVTISQYTNWAGAMFNHTDAGVTSCNSCHSDGADKDAFPANHVFIGATADCVDCHSATQTNTPNVAYSSWLGWDYNHIASNVQSCNTCHNTNQDFDAVSTVINPSHIDLGSSDCVTCHSATLSETPTPFNSWMNGEFDHATANLTSCNQCHAQGNSRSTSFVNANHADIGSSDCLECHSQSTTETTINSVTYPAYTTWAGFTYDHQANNPQSCNNCHSGTSRPGNYPNDHSTVGGADCIDCHDNNSNTYTGPWSWAANSDSYDHIKSGVTNCNSCHNLGSGIKYNSKLSAETNHTAVTTAQCSSCHSASLTNANDLSPPQAAFTGWRGANGAPETMELESFSNGNYTYAAVSLPHPTKGECTLCHKSFEPGVKAFSYDHGVTTESQGSLSNCVTCHSSTSINIGRNSGGSFELNRKNSGHEGLRGGNCFPCHAPNGRQTNNTEETLRYPSWDDTTGASGGRWK